MLRKKILLYILVINISLPVLLSFVNAVSTREVIEEDYISNLINFAEEENPVEEKSEIEKEKGLLYIQFNISPFVRSAISESILCNDSRTLTRNSDQPFSPPKSFQI